MTNDTKRRATVEEGDIYLSSAGDYYVAPKIDAKKIIDLNDNVYARGLMAKQRNLYFSDKFVLEVKDANGNQNEKVELKMMRMCNAPDVSMWAKIQMAWTDEFRFGCSIYNDVWDWVDNVYTLKKFRHLPAQSFNVMPFDSEGAIFCQLLPGITLGDDGEIEFWQSTDEYAVPVQIKDAIMYRNPTSSDIGGIPIILPVIPIINMLSFVWKTQMQQANRTGAKTLFLKITDPLPASDLNGGVSDVAAGKLILKYWGKNLGYVLRGNMEVIDPQIKDDSNNLEIIAALNQVLIDYSTSIDLLTQGNDSARLGGSDTQRMQIIRRHIKSVHLGFEDWVSGILQKYLDANGYTNYEVRVKIPAPEVDTSELDIKRAEIGLTNEILKPNEARALLGQEELTDDEILEMLEFYASKKPAIPASPQFGNPMLNDLENEEDEED